MNTENNKNAAIPDSEIFTQEDAKLTCAGLEEVIIPDTVSIIGQDAFARFAELRNIKLPEGLKRIKSSAFAGCKGLKTVDIPDSVEFIGRFAFYNSGLEKVRFPQSLKQIDSYAFAHCSELKKVALPDNVEYISCSAFKDCTSLAKVKYPPHLVKVGSKENTRAYIDKIFIETTDNDKAIMKDYPYLKKAYKFMIREIKNKPTISELRRPIDLQEEKALIEFVRNNFNIELSDEYIAFLRLRNGGYFGYNWRSGEHIRLFGSYEVIEHNKDRNRNSQSIIIGEGHHGYEYKYFVYGEKRGYRLGDYGDGSGYKLLAVDFGTFKEMLKNMMLSDFPAYYLIEEDRESERGRY